MAESIPFEILRGLYLGVLTGIIPALVSAGLGFVFKYFTGVSIPGFGVVVFALAIAGANGGLLALSDDSLTAGQHGFALTIAILVVLMLSLYAHAQGDKLGGSLPKRITFKSLRERTLSGDVVELVGGRRRVTVTVAGDVDDIEGYPPLSPSLRTELRDGEWEFPADVPLSELESRLAERLRTDYDLAEVTVTLDENARARLAAAPPVGGLSKRLSPGQRAVSVETLVPTGVARGESVTLRTPDRTIDGTVVTVNAAEPSASSATPDADDAESDEDEDEKPAVVPAAPVAAGGEGRLTVAVDRPDAEALLSTGAPQVVVRSRGTRREFELTTLLRRAGRRIQRLSVRSDGALDGTTLGDAGVRDAYDVAVLAVRRDTWRFAPRGDTQLAAGDELFVVGSPGALSAFAEVVA
ncbi:potassium transporter TrkA [Haloprofundus marisrubri]|uniref:Potassium transporter TrkA n=1 Tax=Haloprofundus marisrubri TaxID=1514971 RepID=A0A0W1R754_9EURY|nr:TrkA C-terminal domain-containing protein [Haloprofundus marisrubri]KTG09224.1 potassium transporter TrkA [Haloprofundus marisrubri]